MNSIFFRSSAKDGSERFSSSSIKQQILRWCSKVNAGTALECDLNSQSRILFAALPKPYVSIQDFYREFHLGLCLGAHKNIVSTYDVAFETSGFYVFTQEYAPLGRLSQIIRKSASIEILLFLILS